MAKKKKDVEEAKAETSDGSIAVNDAWTGMLAVSFLALAVGAGFLFYDWYFLYPESQPPAPSKFTQTLPGTPKKEPKVEPKDAGAKDGKDAAPKDGKDAEKKDKAE